MAVIQLAERQGAKEARTLLARRELGVDIGQNALGDAYNRVIRDHPEVTSHDERYEMAFALALSSLSEAMRYLNNDVTNLTEINKE